MTKLILVMAAAAQSGDRRLRLTVRGGVVGGRGGGMVNIRVDRVDLGRWVRLPGIPPSVDPLGADLMPIRLQSDM